MFFLHLCCCCVQVLSPCGMIFHNLVDLTLNTCAQGWWDLVTRMLQDSPKLRSLKLTDVSKRFFLINNYDFFITSRYD